MLEAINPVGDCFTGARYNILRVAALYPLNAEINSTSSKSIRSAIRADNHPLATFKHAQLLSSLTKSDSTESILSSLKKNIKRAHAEVDGGSDVEAIDEPPEKSRKID
jgi:hypothetical protein